MKNILFFNIYMDTILIKIRINSRKKRGIYFFSLLENKYNNGLFSKFLREENLYKLYNALWNKIMSLNKKDAGPSFLQPNI